MVTISTTRFNIHKFYVLPTHTIYVFCMDLRTNSDYFPKQHYMFCCFLIKGGVFTARYELNHRAVGRRPLIAKARVPSQLSPCECGTQGADRSGFSQSTSVSHQNHSANAQLHLHVPLTRRTNGRNLGTFQKAMLFPKSARGQTDTSTFSGRKRVRISVTFQHTT